jgi:two-component system, sensor histidine kinase
MVDRMQPALQPQSPPIEVGTLNVLVVDDSSTNRLILTRLLEAMGHRVETAPDGETAIERVGAGVFDLVLMDVQMPGIGGLEAARRIRGISGFAGRTPIMAVTADASDSERAVYAAVGMNGVTAKPIMAEALRAEVARVVAG